MPEKRNLAGPDPDRSSAQTAITIGISSVISIEESNRQLLLLLMLKENHYARLF
jgi:hypothetical protein